MIIVCSDIFGQEKKNNVLATFLLSHFKPSTHPLFTIQTFPVFFSPASTRECQLHTLDMENISKIKVCNVLYIL